MALKEWNLNFRLEHSDRENRTGFSDVPLLPEIFRWNADPKSLVLFTFQPDFSELFVNGKQPRIRTFAFSSNSLLFLTLLGSRENQTVGVTGKCRRINQLHCSFICLFFCLCLRLRQSDSDLFFDKIISDGVMSRTTNFAYDSLGLFFN